jgi:hypothetical protein
MCLIIIVQPGMDRLPEYWRRGHKKQKNVDLRDGGPSANPQGVLAWATGLISSCIMRLLSDSVKGQDLPAVISDFVSGTQVEEAGEY